MAAVQCKMCGGSLNLPEGMTYGECPYCGSATTFPKLSDDRKEVLYNRAEHFRRLNDFDKALQTYEKILEIDDSDSEIYWGMVLCRYGIEYVEDPVSRERIPTCHRVQLESILQDSDYKSAVEHASGYETAYETEAKKIAEIQKGILAISSQEQPFDVFICYKESTEGGTRTKDSTIAQDIYYQLTNEGYRVFFARITLEDKLGQQYEPYIFAALNSAKVMLVIGSKKEYFEAVWVKNEWSRFLGLMKKDRSKLLIPCYKDMDAYDIPEELSMLQSQDMSKIGFIQDLLRGIKKVIEVADSSLNSSKKQYPHDNSVGALQRRAQISIETQEFELAKNLCHKALDNDPENGWLYFYLFMAERGISDVRQLGKINCRDKNFSLAKRFADDELRKKIDDIEHYRSDFLLSELERHCEYLKTLRESLEKIERQDLIPNLEKFILQEETLLNEENVFLTEDLFKSVIESCSEKCSEIDVILKRAQLEPKWQETRLKKQKERKIQTLTGCGCASIIVLIVLFIVLFVASRFE